MNESKSKEEALRVNITKQNVSGSKKEHNI